MAKIKIEDLPQSLEISDEEMGYIVGAGSEDLTHTLMLSTASMQEMQMSFNLQYLMLQNKISHESRQFTMVSNIMKNKHDTAKNSINNIR